MAGEGFQSQAEKMEQGAPRSERHGEMSGSQWRSFGVVQEVIGPCAVLLGAKADEPLQTRKDGHERVWEVVKTNPHTRRRKGVRQEREWVDS